MRVVPSRTGSRSVSIALAACALIAAASMSPAIAAGQADSVRLSGCYGSTPPQPTSPADGQVISPGQTVEFEVYDERAYEPSSCMFVAIAKAADAARAPEGWYANPVDRCNPAGRTYGSNSYACTPTGTWNQEPGEYKWITYKFSQYCAGVGLCIDPAVERTIIVKGSDPSTQPPAEPKPDAKPTKKCKKKKRGAAKKRKCKKKKKKKKKRSRGWL